MAVAQSTWQAAAARARDLLGIGSTVTARALTAEQTALLTRYRLALRRRIDVAEQLRETHNAVAALCLYREALPLAVAALRLARSGDADASPAVGPAARPDTIDALRTLAANGEIPLLPPVVERAGQLLSATDLLAFDGDSPSDLLIKRDDAAEALKWLARLVGRARVMRPLLGRYPGIKLAVALAVIVIGAVIGRHAMATRNLARGQTVTLSSRHPGSKAPADNSGLVNGEIEPNYGIHTSSGKDSWARIDLDNVYAIGIVKVHNRADGWFDEMLPLTLDISEDGQTFTTVATRTQHFTAADPWIIDVGGRKARAIRVHSLNYVALTEVEVYRAR